jgi:glucose-6-phosphate isomerase
MVLHYEAELERRLNLFEEISAVERIWARDYTFWNPEADEISNRLGWLDLPQAMPVELDRLRQLAEEVADAGVEHLVLLGMGGSSLAPEVFARTLPGGQGSPRLMVLDSTHPVHIQTMLDQVDLRRTMFLVSSKSGSTVETLSLFKFMYARMLEAVDKTEAGSHFLAITDPGSSLAETGHKNHFRRVIENQPDIGGRYSALSFFGLVPAVLTGVDVVTLLSRAKVAANQCQPSVALNQNPAAVLGAFMGEMALASRDKLTLIADEPIAWFGSWVEQLVAESLGKQGKGILPVVNQLIFEPAAYGEDRCFVWLRIAGRDESRVAVSRLQEAGKPVLEMTLDDPFDVGSQMFIWEMATALAGQILEVNPFDQPNVESAKIRARSMIEAYFETGTLPSLDPVLELNGIEIFFHPQPEGGIRLSTPVEVLKHFIAGIPEDGYLAIHAYLDPSPEVEAALNKLRVRLQRLTLRPITIGFGPRFLHSTGQLHKGDSGNGRFLQLTDHSAAGLEIPDEAGELTGEVGFGTLIAAQAQGDWEALIEAGRSVCRLHFPSSARLQLEGLAAGS